MNILTFETINAWTDKDRLNLTTVDSALATQIASQIKSRVAHVFNTSTWIGETTTPTLIQSIIAMTYVGRVYQSKSVDSVDDLSFYGSKLIKDANDLLAQIVSGSIVLTFGSDIIPTQKTEFVVFEPGESEPSFTMEMTF